MFLLHSFFFFILPYFHKVCCSLFFLKKSSLLLNSTYKLNHSRGHVHSFRSMHDNPFTENTTVTALKCHLKEGQSSHPSYSASFSLPPFQAADLSSQVSLGFLSLLMLSQEILNRNETKLFLDSK